ncbi:gluconate 2-dehydrogenase subunit 3 family protein [Sungkyunkwania multivorans]|uniref:Gluconate 2-dehydrogenase subunit 3 family protein n=1 Tax=Sungkyunkwania multivorans TaxID=1173618 RepID=A0ABW3D3H6_9FLAO
MKRRDALRNIGLSFGALVATPTAFSILQSCKTEPIWSPQFFSEAEGSVVKKVMDIIIPSSEELPGALDLNIHMFVDQFILEVVEPEEKEIGKAGLDAFIKKLLASSQKTEIEKLRSEDIEPVLAEALKKTKEEEIAQFIAIGNYIEATKKGETAVLDEDTSIFSFLNSLRSLTIWGYKSSEYIGENVLAYTSIPGQQKGCVSVEEATGGKAWAL